MSDLPELTLVLAAGDFDPWGRYTYLSGTLGPFLSPTESGEGAPRRPYLFPMRWLVDPRRGEAGHGRGLEGIGLRHADRRLVQAAAYRDTFFRDRPMRAFVPSAILTDAPGRYVALALACGGNPYLRNSGIGAADWAGDLARDHEFDDGPGMLERGLMGTGYTSMTLPSDGSAGIEAAHLTLSDGSLLLGWAVCWFNK